MTNHGKRVLVTLITACLLSSAALAPTSTAKPKERRHTQKQDYVLQGIRTQHWDYVEIDPDPLVFHPRRGDRFVHFFMTDAAEDGVMIEARQQAGKGGKDLRVEGCGDSVSMNLVSQKPVEVYVYSGLCTGHEFEVSSTGTITASFSNISRNAYGEIEHQH